MIIRTPFFSPQRQSILIAVGMLITLAFLLSIGCGKSPEATNAGAETSRIDHASSMIDPAVPMIDHAAPKCVNVVTNSQQNVTYLGESRRNFVL
jgi:hypothetical protein